MSNQPIDISLYVAHDHTQTLSIVYSPVVMDDIEYVLRKIIFKCISLK